MSGLRRAGWIVVPAGAALVVAVAITLNSGGTAQFGDAADYLATARSIRQGDGVPRSSSLPFFRAPGYPTAVAMTWAVTGESVIAAKIVSAVAHAATAALVAVLAWRLFRDRTAAVIAGVLHALNPFALVAVRDVQTEPMAGALFVAAVLTVVVGCQSGRSRWFAVAGVLSALAALTRPNLIFLTGAAVAATLFLVVRRRGWRAGWGPALAALAGLAVVLAPWTIANVRATGDLVLITDGDGYNLWLGNHPATRRFYAAQFSSKEAYFEYGNVYLQEELPAAQIAEWRQTSNWDELGPNGRSALWREAAIDEINADLGRAAELVAVKAWLYWRPWISPIVYGRQVAVASAVPQVLLYGAAITGLVVARRRGAYGWGAIVGAISVSGTLAHALTVTGARFRVPVIDPLLTVAAAPAIALAVSVVVTRLRARSGHVAAD